MAFRIHTGNRLEILVDRLAETMRAGAGEGDPLRPERVVVLSLGMKRWLVQQLAAESRLGICCNLEVLLLRQFVDSVLAGGAGAGAADTPQVARWRILRCLRSPQKDWQSGEWVDYLGNDEDGGRAIRLAAALAELFDQYQILRPWLILDWNRGGTAGAAAAGLGDGNAWQARLWREQRQGVAAEDAAIRFERFFRAVRETGGWPGLGGEGRIGVFGINAMPPIYLDFFNALGELITVDFYYLNPCRDYWELALGGKERAASARRYHEHGVPEELLHFEDANPLLAAWGRQGREFYRFMLDLPNYEHLPARFEAASGKSLLAAVQNDVLDNWAGPSRLEELAADDDSLHFHVCHSPWRELEVLRDWLLDKFSRLPDLEPREILVMIPDIARYTPYIEAVFDLPPHRADFIPYSIADRSHPEERPLVKAFFELLRLGGSRFRASEVLDWLEVGAIRRAAGLAEGEVARARDWLTVAGVRWGRDAAHRERAGGVGFEENSWRFGLRRLLLGYAWPTADDTRFCGEVLPCVEVPEDEMPAIGRLAEFVHKLSDLSDRLRSPHPPTAWRGLLLTAIDDLFRPEPEEQAEVELLVQAVQNWSEGAAAAGFTDQVSARAVEYLLEGELRELGGGMGFLRGGVTFCRLQPLRSVPARLLCLLGMNDDAFPRRNRSLTFDLMAAAPKPGDRSFRHEDRYLFLEAVLAAREHLYVSYCGRSIKDNAELPPSILVGELFDCVKALAVGAGAAADDAAAGAGIEARLRTVHPLQPFSPRNFTRSNEKSGKPETEELGVGFMGYSRLDYEGAQALLRQTDERWRFREPGQSLSRPVAVGEGLREVAASDLLAFFAHPARFFIRRCLQFRGRTEETTVEDREPFEIDGIARYLLVDEAVERLLAARQEDEGESLREHADLLAGRGALPPGEGGRLVYSEKIGGRALGLAREIRQRGACDPAAATTVAVDFYDPESSLRVVGSLDRIYPGRRQVLHRPSSTLKQGDLLGTWIRHLLFCLSEESGESGGADGEPVTIYCWPASSKVETIEFRGRKGNERELLLAAIEDCFWPGQLRPLPLIPGRVSMAYAGILVGREGQPEARALALAEARKAWRGVPGKPELAGDGQDEYVGWCFGHDFEEFLRNEGEEFEGLAQTWLAPLLQPD